MSRHKKPWKSGTVVDCFEDIDVCVVTFCLPCLVFSENRSTLHGGAGNVNDEGIDPCLIYCLIMSVSACTLQCLYAYSTRTDIRRKYNLEEEPCDDCMTHICCHCCALCQEHRELRMYPLTTWPLPAIQDMDSPHQTPNTRYQTPTVSYQPSSNTSHQTGDSGYLSSNASRPTPGVPENVWNRQPRKQRPWPHQSPYMSYGPVAAYGGGYPTAPVSTIGSSSLPFPYANYPQPYPGGSLPYVVQGGLSPLNTFPAAPPHPGPVQPLVFEPPRPGDPFNGGLRAGIPAEVYHVPKLPDIPQGPLQPLTRSEPQGPSSQPRHTRSDPQGPSSQPYHTRSEIQGSSSQPHHTRSEIQESPRS